MKPEAMTQQPGHQQQHLVTDQVSECVVHMLEMIDVEHAQPVAFAARCQPTFQRHGQRVHLLVDGRIGTQRTLTQCLEERVIE